MVQLTQISDPSSKTSNLIRDLWYYGESGIPPTKLEFEICDLNPRLQKTAVLLLVPSTELKKSIHTNGKPKHPAPGGGDQYRRKQRRSGLGFGTKSGGHHDPGA